MHGRGHSHRCRIPFAAPWVGIKGQGSGRSAPTPERMRMLSGVLCFTRPSEPTDSRVTDVVAAPDVSQRFARLTPANGLLALMWRELRLSTKPDASCFRACSSLTRPGPYQLVLELRQSAQHCEHETAVRRGRIGPGVVQRSETSAALNERCQQVQ